MKSSDLERIVNGLAEAAASVSTDLSKVEGVSEAVRSIAREHCTMDARHAAMARRVRAKLRSGVRRTCNDPV